MPGSLRAVQTWMAGRRSTGSSAADLHRDAEGGGGLLPAFAAMADIDRQRVLGDLVADGTALTAAGQRFFPECSWAVPPAGGDGVVTRHSRIAVPDKVEIRAICLHNQGASFDKLRSRGNLPGARKTPHAEPVEGRGGDDLNNRRKPILPLPFAQRSAPQASNLRISSIDDCLSSMTTKPFARSSPKF